MNSAIEMLKKDHDFMVFTKAVEFSEKAKEIKVIKNIRHAVDILVLIRESKKDGNHLPALELTPETYLYLNKIFSQYKGVLVIFDSEQNIEDWALENIDKEKIIDSMINNYEYEAKIKQIEGGVHYVYYNEELNKNCIYFGPKYTIKQKKGDH